MSDMGRGLLCCLCSCTLQNLLCSRPINKSCCRYSGTCPKQESFLTAPHASRVGLSQGISYIEHFATT